MKNLTKNNKGQMVIEMILIFTVILAIVTALRTTMRDSEVIQTMVQGPWQVLSGMMMAGNWNPPDQAVLEHPAIHTRHGSVEGETP